MQLEVCDVQWVGHKLPARLHLDASICRRLDPRENNKRERERGPNQSGRIRSFKVTLEEWK